MPKWRQPCAVSAAVSSLFERHIETPDIEVEILAYLRGAEAELLRGVVVAAMRTAAVPGVPFLHSRAHGGAELAPQKAIDPLQRTERIGHELAVVHVQKTIIADPRPRRHGSLGTDPQMLRIVPPEFFRTESLAGRLERT